MNNWLYEEEDYSLSTKELLYRASIKESRTIVSFFFLVLECFMPASLLNQLKNRNSAQK